ncbi:HrpJ domain-containing protein [Herbaspirillum sp. RTI4]|uniref:HrpJ domain-containing protein n=1 Tax=Herbaspirillum sp. RTI4 TaxID=3048640 RepID=UPI003A0FC306
MNVAVNAKLFSAKLHLNPKVLRRLYRNFLENSEDALFIYRQWIEEYGLERRHALVDFVSAALVSDIYSLDPSCSNIEFNSLLFCNVRLRLIRSSGNPPIFKLGGFKRSLQHLIFIIN